MILDSDGRDSLLTLWCEFQVKDLKTRNMLKNLMDFDEQIKIERIDIEMKFRMMPSIPGFIANENNDGMINVKKIDR